MTPGIGIQPANSDIHVLGVDETTSCSESRVFRIENIVSSSLIVARGNRMRVEQNLNIVTNAWFPEPESAFSTVETIRKSPVLEEATRNLKVKIR